MLNVCTKSARVIIYRLGWVGGFCTGSHNFQGRNMVYPGPIDPYFLAVILIPEPHFPPNFDP